MDTLLSVMMFLGTIAPNHTYTSSFLGQQVTMQNAAIMNIEHTPPLIHTAIQAFYPLAPSIIIINDDDNEFTQPSN